jgi:hypothetical protein
LGFGQADGACVVGVVADAELLGVHLPGEEFGDAVAIPFGTRDELQNLSIDDWGKSRSCEGLTLVSKTLKGKPSPYPSRMIY